MSDIASVQQRTHALLEQIFNEPVGPPDDGVWHFTYGTATLLIFVQEHEEAGIPVVAVAVASPILSDVERSPELLGHLNDMNGSMLFGHAYWSNGFVWVRANLVGETLDRVELEQAMNVVGHWADTLDEPFAQRFGAQLATPEQEPPAGAWAPQPVAVGGPPGPPPPGSIGPN